MTNPFRISVVLLFVLQAGSAFAMKWEGRRSSDNVEDQRGDTELGYDAQGNRYTRSLDGKTYVTPRGVVRVNGKVVVVVADREVAATVPNLTPKPPTKASAYDDWTQAYNARQAAEAKAAANAQTKPVRDMLDGMDRLGPKSVGGKSPDERDEANRGSSGQGVGNFGGARSGGRSPDDRDEANRGSSGARSGGRSPDERDEANRGSSGARSGGRSPDERDEANRGSSSKSTGSSSSKGSKTSGGRSPDERDEANRGSSSKGNGSSSSKGSKTSGGRSPDERDEANRGSSSKSTGSSSSKSSGSSKGSKKP